ncbi:hypothetical protein AMAG_05938 [Allomyces macrogynus ATCC 38327]|uniref:LIM zinc-binding domain-containing protein n=1 Tax=Allomyces macrogynus (strain ATCC 38327) TaxID=578462 RepID=A0A0L0SDJ7_ALLM3|nr:hypothetical protein AMAG_05938 [Allomyces macrogynus ATCC 38327]|eukprot:KNE60561.1 hypothetical protein AMAG_05938 [Allomyces macrogynus ATCC 38327]
MSRIVFACAVCSGALRPGVPANCSHCHQPFPDGVFFDLDGKPLCEADFNDLVSDKCHACGLAIESPCVNALDTKFHAACFKCHLCRETLKGAFLSRTADRVKTRSPTMVRPTFSTRRFEQIRGNLGALLGAPRVERTLFATSCQRCKKPIDGTPFIYRGAKYHVYHFNCSLCELELTPQCKEHNGKPYCPEDYLRVTAPHGQPQCPLHDHEATGAVWAVLAGLVDAHGKKWCGDHFLCTACDKSLAVHEFCGWDCRPLCTPCFGKLPLKVRKRLNDHRLQVEKRKRAAGK